MPRRITVLLSEALKGHSIDQPVLEDLPHGGVVDELVDCLADLGIGEVKVVLHFFRTFTRPSPPHLGHFLYPVFPPVFRLRYLIVTRCFANEITTYGIIIATLGVLFRSYRDRLEL